jgi:hypothetical protein
MDALTKGEAKRWCQAQGASFGERDFPVPKSRAAEFKIPPDAGQRVALVASHLEPFEAAGKTLVWFDDWAVWPSGQRMHIFERFLRSYGDPRPLIERPAFLFSKGEFEDLVSFATIGVLFLWDVHVVSAKARQLVFYSHDEYGWKA